jgi:PKD domain-containing protein
MEGTRRAGIAALLTGALSLLVVAAEPGARRAARSGRAVGAGARLGRAGQALDSTQRNPQFAYSSPGTYSVKLTASNGSGLDDEVKVGYVTVNPGSPPSGTQTLTRWPTRT